VTRVERSAKRAEITEAIGCGIFAISLVAVMILYLWFYRG